MPWAPSQVAVAASNALGSVGWRLYQPSSSDIAPAGSLGPWAERFPAIHSHSAYGGPLGALTILGSNILIWVLCALSCALCPFVEALKARTPAIPRQPQTGTQEAFSQWL